MRQEREQRDYCEMSMKELVNKLYKLKRKLMHDLMYELTTNELAEELRAWADGACIDVDALTDELAEHIDALGDMKRICEEMLRAVSDKEFDD